MKNIILYSTGCPKCNVLKRKLAEKNVDYEEVNDTELMLELGFTQVPVLRVNGNVMSFADAVTWLNSLE